jgi:RNA polymerase sigma factor (sigma-70 family)
MTLDDRELQDHLSRISTMWTVVFQAHRGSADTVALAQEKLLERYGGAVYRYLVSILRDSHAADELAQEFALHFVKGDFKGADPERGRFRDYVKTALFNLMRKYHKRRLKQPRALDSAVAEPAAQPDDASAEAEFLKGWRDELLARTWEVLSQFEKETGQPYHLMLYHKTNHPEQSSTAMAEQMSARLGKKISAPAVRQIIHRARAKFAELLLEEVARSLATADKEAIAQELADLGLLPYCQDALTRKTT